MTAVGRGERRLRRQIAAISGLVPRLREPINGLLYGRMRFVRLPLGIMLILGGLLWFLPVLGLWMLPLGLLVLALDLPVLQGPVSAATIRARRHLRGWWRGRRS